MIHRRLAILTFVSLLAITSNVQAVDKEKLRRTISLPQFSLILGYGINGRGDFGSLSDIATLLEKIPNAEKEVNGSARDAESYRNLGRLYGLTGQSAKSKDAFRKAEKLCRQQIEQHPGENVWSLRLADTLWELDQLEEAEKLWRHAVKHSPTDWRGWVGLARLLDSKAHQAIMGSTPLPRGGPDNIIRVMQAAAPTRERIAQSQRYREEAAACFDHAIELAPREPTVFRQRGASRYNYEPLDFGLRLYRREQADFFTVILSPKALPDLRRAEELSQDEYRGIGMVVLMDVMAETNQYHLQNPTAKPPAKRVDILSEVSRKRVRMDMARLEKGIDNSDNHKAAEAAEVLGFLKSTILSDDTAEKHLRRSIELDPSRNVAWDMLIFCLGGTNRYREEVDMCHQRLNHKDSAHNRLFLAKAYEHLDQLNKAEEVIHTGLQREPDDFMLNVAFADLLLMRGNDEGLKQAGQILYRMRQDHLPEGGNENRWANYTVASGIYFGLVGEVKRARDFLLKVRKLQPEYPHIEEALKALDEPDEPISPRPSP